MSRKFILTKAVLASIPELLAYGSSKITECRGCKLSTLKVRCSQERIRLSRRRRGPRELASQNQADHDQHGRHRDSYMLDYPSLGFFTQTFGWFGSFVLQVFV